MANLEISSEDKLNNKSTAIKNIAKSYEMRCKGWKPDTSNENWIPTGEPQLASGLFISSSTAILTSFCEYANLITTKDKVQFFRQYKDAFKRINYLMLNSPADKPHNVRIGVKLFKDAMVNIGDIICGSRELIIKFNESKELEPTTTY